MRANRKRLDGSYLNKKLVQVHHRDGFSQTACDPVSKDELLSSVHSSQALAVVLLAFRKPSLWSEYFSVISKDRVQLRAPRIKSNTRAGWDVAAIRQIVALGWSLAFPEHGDG